MDLNYVLLWIVGLSAGVGLLGFGLRFRGRFKGWLAVFVVILTVLGAGLWLFPERAGYAAGAVWALLFLAPMWGQRWVQRLAARQRYRAARRIASVLALLHPSDGWADQPAFLDVLDQLYRGDVDGARRRLEALGPGEGRLAQFARLQLFRFEARWREARRWIEDHVDPEALVNDPQTFTTYLRSLGEVGEPATMLRVYGEAAAHPSIQQARVHMLLFLFSMTGRPAAVHSLFEGALRHFPAGVRDFWIATSLQVADRAAEAEPMLKALLAGDDPMLRRASRQRLEAPLPILDVDELAPELASLLAGLEKSAADLASYGTLGAPPRRGSTRVSWVLVAGMSAAFVAEIPGGSTDPLNLVSLGALVVTAEAMPGTWWRVVTAAFLHFGAVHFVLNAVGLWFLGRYMERLWGGGRLGICFLVSAIVANVAAAFVLVEPGVHALVVGASGGVMGVLGALVALIAVEWRRTGVVLLKRQLWFLAVVLALQIVFDIFTPRVSSTIHMSGLAIGALLGALFAIRSRAAR